MMRSIFLLVCSSVLSIGGSGRLYAQFAASHPFSVFQRHADSTIVLETLNTWFHGKDYLLVSKKGDTVHCFSYQIGRKAFYQGSNLINGLDSIMWNQTVMPYIKDIGFNPYLRVLPIRADSAGSIWNAILDTSPWTLADDAIDGHGCPPDSTGKVYGVFDANVYRLTLITGDQIKTLEYDAPEYYAAHCPGQSGRKGFLMLKAIFDQQIRQPEVGSVATTRIR